MLLQNAFTLVSEDGRPQNEVETREEWYYFQRATKSYWAAYQVQYMGVVVMLVPNIPTSLLNWIYTCTYSISVGFGGPGLGPLGGAPSSKRSLDQFNTVNNNRYGGLVYGAVGLWAAFLVISVLGYLIGLLISSAIRGGGDRRGTMIKTRLIYIFVRITDLFYFGIVASSTAQLASAKYISVGELAAAGIAFAVIGIIIPVCFVIRTLTIPLSDLLKKDEFKFTWISMFGIMKPRFRKFAGAPWIKRFFIAVAFGAFANISIVAQLSISVLVSIIYVIAIFVLDPYADYLHHYLDLITTGLTALSFLPLYGYATNIAGNSTAIIAITALFLIFQLLSFVVCIGMFVYSWMQLRGVYQLSQIGKCCSG